MGVCFEKEEKLLQKISTADAVLTDSCSRVGLLVHIFELPLHHMGIDLGGGNVRVAQHLLDGPQVRAVFQ